MHFITKDDLKTIGIQTSNDTDIDSLLAHLNEQLEERVGTAITEKMNDTQLDEYLSLQETTDDETLENWLQSNIPEIPAIIQDEIDILLGELAENAESI